MPLSDTDTRQLAGLLSRVIDATRDCRNAMSRFSTLGSLSHDLSSEYPALRQLRAVITALESATIEIRGIITSRRREAIGIPMRSARRHRKSMGDQDTNQLRRQAAAELDVARRHISHARQLLQRAGGRKSLDVDLGEQITFLGLARDACTHAHD